MDFIHTQDFPVGLDQLWTVFGQVDYPRQKYRALGATEVRMHRFEATAQAIEVDLERDVPVDASRVPSWARTLVGSQQTLRHRTQWRRVGAAQVVAELDISPARMPVRAHAEGTIDGARHGATRMVLNWHVESGLPLIGPRIERLFADQVRAALDDDLAFTLGYLEQAKRRGSGAGPRGLDTPLT